MRNQMIDSALAASGEGYAMSRLTRRAVLRVGIGGLAAVPLAACAGTSTSQRSASASTSAAAVGPGKLTGKVSFMAWGSPQAVVERKQFCIEFDKEHPGASCSFIYAPGNYMDKLLAMVAGNDAPDVFFVSPTDLPEFIGKNFLHPLDAFIASSHYDVQDFIPAALKQYQQGGKTYGLPRGFGMEAVFYNVDLFHKAQLPSVPADWKNTSWTFSALLQRARQLTSGSGPTKTFGYIVDPSNYREWMTYVWSNGGEVFNHDYTQCLLDQPPAVAALQFLQDLIVKYKVAPTPAIMQTSNAMNMFDSGRVAMSISEPFTFAQRRKDAKFTWDVGVTPAGKHGRIPGGGGVGWGIYARTKLPELAWQVLAGLAGKRFQTEELRDGTTAPPRLSVLKSKAFLNPSQPPAHAALFVEEVHYVRTDPQPPNWAEISTALNKEFSYLWTGERTALTVAKAAVAAVTPLLGKPVA
jgi:multiple sugar transport system substrate-binding protein